MPQRMTIFEQIRRTDEQGNEYWSSRELAKAFGYRDYQVFPNVITKAETACRESGQVVDDHFRHLSEMVQIGSGAERPVDVVHLSRYACYLVVQNADSRKPAVS